MFAPETALPPPPDIRIRQRFNEAGACLPRKPALAEEAKEAEKRASMRPGHVCPGNFHRGAHFVLCGAGLQ